MDKLKIGLNFIDNTIYQGKPNIQFIKTKARRKGINHTPLDMYIIGVDPYNKKDGE